MTFGGGTGRIKMWWEVGSLLECGEIFLGGEENDQNFRLVGEGEGGGGWNSSIPPVGKKQNQ